MSIRSFLKNLFGKQVAETVAAPEEVKVPAVKAEEPVKIISKKLAEVAEKKGGKVTKEAKAKKTEKVEPVEGEKKSKPRRRRKPKPKNDEGQV